MADYADQYFEYDDAQRVTTTVVQGAGCSSCTGGQGDFNYAYQVSAFADGYNNWRIKTTETLPDGNERIVFTNFAGQVILDVFHDTTSDDEWITWHKYDNDGRLVQTAHPSAIIGYDETKADLLDNQGGNYHQLRDSAGLIEVYSYASSTTATTTTAGNVDGYLHQSKIKRGETGTEIVQSTADYIERTAGGTTIYQPASGTVYRNDNGTGGQTTSSSYTWHSGTTQVESVEVSLPVVTTAQNGPNTADGGTTYFDDFGRPIWHKDADGFLTYTAYDPATNAAIKTIVDVDTTQTSDFTGLPSGWSTPTGGGLHLITTMEVDDLGRTTKLTDPNGNVTYTLFDDDNYETRVYAGWDTSTDKPTGPTQVSRLDRAGSYTETITMSATPSLNGSDEPTGGESISSIKTLSRSYTNDAGQVTHTDVYFNLSGLTYSTSTSLGTEGTHFYRTEYSYDSRGRQHRVEDPTGTITRTIYDGLSRVIATWVGTDDVPFPSGELHLAKGGTLFPGKSSGRSWPWHHANHAKGTKSNPGDGCSPSGSKAA